MTPKQSDLILELMIAIFGALMFFIVWLLCGV